MKIAQVNVSTIHAYPIRRVKIPAGIIGAQIRFNYTDPMWGSLDKTAVFKAGGVTKDVLHVGEVVTIPAEVVAKPGTDLKAGIYGTDAEGNIAIPTLWANVGPVMDAADPSGDPTTDPSLPVWAQIKAMIGNLDDLNTEAKQNLVAAVNEALTKGGTVDAAEIQKIVEDYLEQNPVEADLTGAVMYSEAQPLTAEEQSQARENIGAGQPLLIVTLSERDGSSHTASEIKTAVDAGQNVRMLVDGETVFELENVTDELATFVSMDITSTMARTVRWFVYNDGIEYGDYKYKPNIPTALPNPEALTFTGAVKTSYNGSEAVSVEIPVTYTKSEIDAIMGRYITDIDVLIGGGV